MKVHEALLEVMRAIPAVRKEDRNTVGKGYNFRGIDAVLNAVGPVLREKGVMVIPTVIEHQSGEVVVGQNRTPMRMVTMLVQYTFIGPEGDVVAATVPGEAFDAGDKSYSKAMSVAFRTALLQTLALPTDDRDADADTYERASAQSAATERANTSTQKRTQQKSEPSLSPADVARDELLVVVGELNLDPGDVAQLYLTENKVRLQNETREGKIREFADRLEAKR